MAAPAYPAEGPWLQAGVAYLESLGYRVRLDSRVSAGTRIEVLTEGLLTRRLQRDPELPDVGLLIFDEFHERSAQADLGLALAAGGRVAAVRKLGVGIVRGMPIFMKVLVVVGTAAMIWVVSNPQCCGKS